MSYYERWLVSLAQKLIERGIVTTAELAPARCPRWARAAITTWAANRRARSSTTEHDYATLGAPSRRAHDDPRWHQGPEALITVDELRKNIEALPPMRTTR